MRWSNGPQRTLYFFSTLSPWLHTAEPLVAPEPEYFLNE